VIDEAGRVSYQDLTRLESRTENVDDVPMEITSNGDDVPMETNPDPTDTEHQVIGVEPDSIETDGDLTHAEHIATVSDHETNDGIHSLNESENVPIDNYNNTSKTDLDEDADKNVRQTKGKNTKNTLRTARPVRMKTLSACLTLFGLFKNPSKVYQEPAMTQIYLTLLTQKDGEIQKLAIACLMAYKFNYLLPYKENLDRLMEDKTFRDELMCFSSDEELNVVISEHRADFIHILIRCV
jgi:hypothetical protein